MRERFGRGRWALFLAPIKMSRAAWVEAPLLVALAILITWWAYPEDPLSLKEGGRWPLLAALLVSLRYGSLAGVLSMLTLILGWQVSRAMGFYPTLAFPEMTFLWGFILVLITGEFSDIWRLRLQRTESESAYAVERLGNLTQRHALLRLSHDRLEENLLMRPYTIRDALLRLRDLALYESHTEALPAADELLNLLGEYCQLQRGALYAVRAGIVSPTPVAMLGEIRELNPQDRLLRFAMDNGALAHIQMAEQDDSYDGDYWVCAPVASSAGEIIGVVIVQRMPFMSLNLENLQLFAVLLNFYADLVQGAPGVEPLCRQLPGLPPPFARELVALSDLAAEGRMDTTLVLFSAADGLLPGQILDALNRRRGELDRAWWLDHSRRRLMWSMPMTGSAGFESFLLRTEQWLQDNYGLSSLGQAGILFVRARLDGRPVGDQLRDLIEAVDHV